MSKRLEDFIKANREEFDELEPRAGLWDQIENRLPAQFGETKKIETIMGHPSKTETDKLPHDSFITLKKTNHTDEKKTFSLGFVLRVAASVIVVMSISFVLYLHNGKGNNNVNLAAINPEYAEQQVHYASLITTKRTELKTLTKGDPQLYAEFNAEITKMDSTYKKLNKDIATSPDQEAVLKAMIHNLQIQSEILNQQLMVIEQFNQMKKAEGNEIKNI
jgi:hypothetical protein